jgi:ABC-type molybdate transport system substrate-binding protein
MRPAGVASAAVLAVALTLAGCAGGHDGPGSDPPAGADPTGGLTRVRVLADESLRPAFDQVETMFEAQHPSIEVVLAYGAGIDLARQIAGGETAEVFATDDVSAMATAGLTEKAEVFGGGRLSVAPLAPAGEPFVAFVKEGAAQRILTDTGILRP